MDAIARKANRGTDTAADCLAATLDFFGFTRDSLLKDDTAGVDTVAIGKAIADRLAAFAAKDFAKADAIRAEMLTQGVQLMDYKTETGERATRWEIKR